MLCDVDAYVSAIAELPDKVTVFPPTIALVDGNCQNPWLLSTEVYLILEEVVKIIKT